MSSGAISLSTLSILGAATLFGATLLGLGAGDASAIAISFAALDLPDLVPGRDRWE
jgi:hypothetical protein